MPKKRGLRTEFYKNIKWLRYFLLGLARSCSILLNGPSAFTAELPGVRDKDLEVSLAGDVLTIKGEKKTETEETNGNATYTERRYGSFTRSLRLPFEVKDEEVDAKFKDGVLTVRLPKPADMQKQVRRIEVKAQ